MNGSTLFPIDGHWHPVTRCDVRARELADRHYSRQTVGADDFMASGKTLVMLTTDALAVWGAIENMDPAGSLRWRCSIFRNEGSVRSSDLVREATSRTYVYWDRHYGGRPAVPLTTEIDPSKTRRKRDPGRCFLRAGWRRVDVRRGLVVLQAPEGPSTVHVGPGIDPPGQAHSDRNGPIQDPRLRSTGGMHASGRAAAGGSGGDR